MIHSASQLQTDAHYPPSAQVYLSPSSRYTEGTFETSNPNTNTQHSLLAFLFRVRFTIVWKEKYLTEGPCWPVTGPDCGPASSTGAAHLQEGHVGQ